MAEELVVKGASVRLTPVISTVKITPDTHTISLAPSGMFTSSEGNEMLLESDLDASFATFMASYDNGAYLTGAMQYQSLKSVTKLSELIKKNGDFVVTKKTEGTITCTVTVAAQNPSPSPDPITTYDIDFSFTDAAQTLVKSD